MKEIEFVFDRPLNYALVDIRGGRPFIMQRFPTLHEAIIDRRLHNRQLRIYRCVYNNGIQELSRKEAASERAAWAEMVAEESLHRRQQFEDQERAQRERDRAEFIALQDQILEREKQRRTAERE